MAKPFLPKRNTTAKNDEFTGRPYEITLDCERQELRIHDGLNAGGFPTARAADLKTAVRMSHTQYNVGDIVACPDRNDVVLECLLAGQTANRYVNFKNIIGGAGVTDGSVVWQLKIPYVKTINGVEVDRYGNIDVEGIGGVKTVNGKAPDSSGDVTIGEATQSMAGLMTAADKIKLDDLEKVESYTLPVAGENKLGGVMTTSEVTDPTGLVPCPIVDGIPYYKGPSVENALTQYGVTATASELNVLDGVTISTKELNYLKGVNSGIQSQLDGKLASSGTASKATSDANGNNIANTYATKTALNDGLNGKSDKTHTHSLATTSTDGFMSSSDKSKLTGIAAGANKYTHPSYTTKSNGFYKVTVDSLGHVSGTSNVTKSDITALGIPAQDTTYVAATQSANGLMSASDKKKIDSVESGANKYILPPALPGLLGGVKVGNNITLKEGEISIDFDDVVNALGWIPLKTVNSHEADIHGNVDVSAGFFETDGIKSARLGDETNYKDKYVYAPDGGQWFCFGYVTEYVDGTDGDYDIYTYHVQAGLYPGGTRFPNIQRGSGSWDVNNIICLRNADGEWE